MSDQANNEGGDDTTPEPMGGETMVVRLDVPYSDLAPEGQNQYMMAVANCVGAMMPPGPDPAGRALFFLLIPDVDQTGKLPYVTNADVATLAPSLRHLAARFAGANPDQLAAPETVVEALRRLSDAVEAYHETPTPEGAKILEHDAARSHAMEVLDALAPDVVTPKVEIRPAGDPEEIRDADDAYGPHDFVTPDGGATCGECGLTRDDPIHNQSPEDSDHAPETVPPGTTGDDHDRRSDLHGEGVQLGNDAPAPGKHDPEPFRPHPPGGEI